MANRVNLKVSEVTHEAITAEKREGESIDDVLRRKLGLKTTTEDIQNDLAAYLPDDLREQAQEAADLIGSVANFQTEVDETGGTANDPALKFKSEDSSLTIAQLECGESGYTVKYRDQHGDLDAVFIQGESNDKDFEANNDEIRRRVKGAYRKWG